MRRGREESYDLVWHAAKTESTSAAAELTNCYERLLKADLSEKYFMKNL